MERNYGLIWALFLVLIICAGAPWCAPQLQKRRELSQHAPWRRRAARLALEQRPQCPVHRRLCALVSCKDRSRWRKSRGQAKPVHEGARSYEFNVCIIDLSVS